MSFDPAETGTQAALGDARETIRQLREELAEVREVEAAAPFMPVQDAIETAIRERGGEPPEDLADIVFVATEAVHPFLRPTMISPREVELPAPTGWINADDDDDGHDCLTPVWRTRWNTVTAWADGVEIDDSGPEDVEQVRAYAMALLAACAQVQAWRAAPAPMSGATPAPVSGATP